MLVLTINTLIEHGLRRLHVSQWFHCVITFTVHKTRFERKITVFSAKERVLAHLTSFQLNNEYKRKGKFVIVLNNLILYSSIRLRNSQCIHCVITDSVHKTRF